ncbi:retinol dehydrogenase [Moniliophthora roreri MCA 2997]|uniref:Retinol dehydrogenase n=1 Tax=Moniliophthora roreri (strain MCA 2997) TaxID=1381753 RepID=V2XYC1_MONRO|nr:retinol dehydrogenase [Moniliophthora roreri MCA 2997]
MTLFVTHGSVVSSWFLSRAIFNAKTRRKANPTGKVVVVVSEADNGVPGTNKKEKQQSQVSYLASFNSVKCFVDKFERECDRLEILVENAGILAPQKYQAIEDGWSSILQVNVIAPAIHALLLLSTMLRTTKAFGDNPSCQCV